MKDGDSNFSLLDDYLNNDDDPRNKEFVGIINLLKPLLSGPNNIPVFNPVLILCLSTLIPSFAEIILLGD